MLPKYNTAQNHETYIVSSELQGHHFGLIFLGESQLHSQTFENTCERIVESADPSRRDRQISYAGSKRCRRILIQAQNPKSKIQTPNSKLQNPRSKIQNPKSKIQNPRSKIQNPNSQIQNPNSKIQTGPFGAATKRTKTKLIQNPKSKIQNPKSKIQNPRSKIQNPKSKIQDPKSKIQNPKSKIQNPKSKIQDPKSKIQNPNSKLQNPKSKIQTARLEFGFWLRSGRGRGRWPCSKWRCMAVLATQTWPSWRHTGLQPKGCRFDSPHARPKLGTDFRRRGFAGNRGSISGPVSQKSGPNFRRNCGPGGVVGNVGSTSRKKKKIQAFKIYLYLYVNIIYKSCSTLSTIPGPMQQISRVGGWQALACLNKDLWNTYLNCITCAK